MAPKHALRELFYWLAMKRRSTQTMMLGGEPSQGYAGLCALLAMALGILAWQRLSAFQGQVPLWRDTLVKNSDSLIGNTQLCNALRESGAGPEYQAALGRGVTAYSAEAARRPLVAKEHKEFGWLLIQANRKDEAAVQLEMAVTGDPTLFDAHTNLAMILLERNSLADARKHFAAALGVSPELAAALFGMGQVALAERDYAAAVDWLEKAVRLRPTDQFRAALEHARKLAGQQRR